MELVSRGKRDAGLGVDVGLGEVAHNACGSPIVPRVLREGDMDGRGAAAEFLIFDR